MTLSRFLCGFGLPTNRMIGTFDPELGEGSVHLFLGHSVSKTLGDAWIDDPDLPPIDVEILHQIGFGVLGVGDDAIAAREATANHPLGVRRTPRGLGKNSG